MKERHTQQNSMPKKNATYENRSVSVAILFQLVNTWIEKREREKKNNNTKALLNLWLAISEWVGERLKIQEENPDEIMNMHDSHISNQLEMKWSYVWNTNTNTSAQNTVIQENNTLL